MRFRTLLLVLAVAAIGLFAWLNWTEIMRPVPLTFGLIDTTAPLGAILLTLLVLVVLIGLVASASAHTRHLAETRHHVKALQAQRDLAERAEASRFTDLRTQLDTHLRELRQRDTTTATEIEQGMSRLRNQLDQLHRTMGMRLGELEARLEARLQTYFTHAPTVVVPDPAREPASVQPGPVQPEIAHPAAAARLQAAREERAVRDEAVRDEVLVNAHGAQEAQDMQRAQAAHGPGDNDRGEHDGAVSEHPRADEPPPRKRLFDRLR